MPYLFVGRLRPDDGAERGETYELRPEERNAI